ncbi:Ig-like domain-containing protein [Mycobacterium sp. RTGN5]|uniref:Ig-like domain-containing protein n=1 Tax=Mycobacterium sp. RTGN5 TaxID=3016522 RepID=UPI0029C6F5EB|nr:Ig-like domain-containing protein [Mycobacterium sp. RTGN5]
MGQHRALEQASGGGAAKYVGRVGALAVALGIGAWVGGGAGIAYADDGTGSSDSGTHTASGARPSGSNSAGTANANGPGKPGTSRIPRAVVKSNGGAQTGAVQGALDPAAARVTAAPSQARLHVPQQRARATSVGLADDPTPDRVSTQTADLTPAVASPVAAALPARQIAAPVSRLQAAVGIAKPTGLTSNSTPSSPLSGLFNALQLIRREIEHSLANRAPRFPGNTTSVSTYDETPVVVPNLAATDADGDTITYSAPGGPSHGTVTIIGNTVTYTPDEGFVGEDSFTLKASDGASVNGFHFHGLASLLNPATAHADTEVVNVHVAAVDPPAPPDPQNPYTPDVLHEGDPAGTVRGHVNATDPQGLPITYSYTGGAPADGSALTVGSDGSFVYTPSAAARHDAASTDAATTGADTFAFTVTATNSHGVAADIAISVPIDPANEVPVAPVSPPAPTVSDHGSGIATGSVGYVDPDGDALTYTGPVGGHTSGGGAVTVHPDGTYTYTPEPADRHAAAADGASLSDSFDVTITDGHGFTQTVTVHVPIDPTNKVPVAPVLPPAPTVSDHGSGIATGSVGYVDPDGDVLTYAGPVGGHTSGGGTVTVNPNGTYTYTPDPADRHAAAAGGAAATDSFDVTIADGHGFTQTVTVHVPIDPTNKVPVGPISPPVATVDHGGGSVTGTLGYTDPDNDALHYANPAGGTSTSWTTASGGSVTIDPTTGAYTYTPDQQRRLDDYASGNTTDTDSFDVVVTDGHGFTKTVTVSVPVDPTAAAATSVTRLDTPDQGGALVIASDGTIYRVTFRGGLDDYTVVSKVNPTTGALTPIGQPLNGYPNGDPVLGADGTIYQVTGVFGNDPGTSTTTVWAIDPDTGVTTDLAVINDRVNGPLTVGSNGTLYQSTYDVDVDGNAHLQLTVIDPAHSTSVTIPIEGQGGNSFTGLFTNANGNAYFVTVNDTSSSDDDSKITVVVIDADNPTDAHPATVVIDGYPRGVTVAPDGTAYVTTDDETWMVDPDTAAATQIAMGSSAIRPWGAVAIGSDGKAYQAVSIYDNTDSRPAVVRIDPGTATATVVATTTDTGYPIVGLQIAPDGTYVVRGYYPDGVSANWKLVAFHPDGTSASIPLEFQPSDAIVFQGDRAYWSTYDYTPDWVAHFTTVDLAAGTSTTTSVPGLPGPAVVGPDGTGYLTVSSAFSDNGVGSTPVVLVSNPANGTTTAVPLPDWPLGPVTFGADGTAYQLVSDGTATYLLVISVAGPTTVSV